MEQEFILLLITAISLGFLHTLSGPDHYIPFIAFAKAGNWTIKRTAWFTGLCGIAHIGGALLIGLAVSNFAPKLPFLHDFASLRGSFIAWLFISLGVIYMIKGIKQLFKRKYTKSIQPKPEYQNFKRDQKVRPKRSSIYWILFIIFLFGPCEPLIPFLLYPAENINTWAMITVIGAFGASTVITMQLLVLIPLFGLNRIRLIRIERYRDFITGTLIAFCGIGIQFLGL